MPANTGSLVIANLGVSSVAVLMPLLSTRGYRVGLAESWTELLQAVVAEPDIVVCSLTTPAELPHLTALRQCFQQAIIVIGPPQHDQLLSAALAAGADDFVQRPFSASDLLARISTQLRRRRSSPVLQVRCGSLYLNLQQRSATFAGQPLELADSEFALLTIMANQARYRYSARHLLVHVWGEAFADDFDLLQLTIHRLRRLLADDPQQPRYLRGDLNSGYWLACSN